MTHSTHCPIYELTRRRGESGTITRVTDSDVPDRTTGEIVDTTEVISIRRMVRETTRFSRIIRSQAVQTDIGQTSFICWIKDFSNNTAPNLDSEDTVTYDSNVYKVVSTFIEDNAFVITADRVLPT
jgi:hypothetical protein